MEFFRGWSFSENASCLNGCTSSVDDVFPEMKHILFPTGLFTLWFSRGEQTMGLSMGLQMRIISAG